MSALSIGLLASVRSGVMSLNEAEQLLFTPRTSRVLGDKGILEISQLVMDCCELEDVLSLVPDRFDENIQIMIDKYLDFLRHSKSSETDQGFMVLR
ncbi:DUF3969 family protein [Pseudomonas asplenii]|uniref:DUF3969 family protein n=1 Tax=Pseudomonas asplenii TaxID=53407 RepID=UPI0009B60C19